MARFDCEGFHRRDFLKVGSAGFLGLTLPGILRHEAQAAADPTGKAKAKSVIFVWLAGGPATIDMWDLRPDAPDTIRGPFKEIQSRAPGVRISEHLPLTANVLDKCTIVRSIYHTIPSHGTASVWMSTGNKPTSALQYPSLGALAAKLLPAPLDLPPFVAFSKNRGSSPGYLGTTYSPFEVQGVGDTLKVRGISLPNNFSQDDLADRDKILRQFDKGFLKLDKSSDVVAGLDKFQQQALDILRSDRTKKAFDMSQEPESVSKKYGKDSFGKSALAARRLVEAGVRFVTIGTGGWDTHGKNFDALKSKRLPPVDQVLSALVSDLDERGLLDSTIVYCAGEFGRTPKINKKQGRDHWSRSMAVFLAGGGFKRGYAHGATDKNGMAPATDPCLPDDVAATIFHNLGIEANHELQTQTGRPIALFRDGNVIDKLLA